jgi:hypothetical protein
MAKKLAEYSAAVKTIESTLKDAEAGMERFLNNRQKQKGALVEGGNHLKAHIVELKKKGKSGASLKDFAATDKETLQLVQGMKKLFADVIGTVNSFNAEYKKFVGGRDQLKKIAETLDAEVALRDKKKEGLIAIDSKSLPDLKKLQTEVTKKVSTCRDTLGIYALIDDKKEQTQFDQILAQVV